METPDRLEVWLQSQRSGELLPDGRGFRFQPISGGPPLTIGKPGGDATWDRTFSRAWFEGLLPEGEQRTAAELRHRVERGDTFGLLAAIGWECAGAVSVLPPGRTPEDGTYRPLTHDEVGARIDAAPAIVDEVDMEVRMSLGGAQEKLLLTWDGTDWLLPLGGAPSTHILKPEPRRFPGLVRGEAWAMTAAAAVTSAADVAVRTSEDHRSALVVTRYDRVQTADGLRRVHQEDLCQVLGLPPEAKYARPGPRMRAGDPQLRNLAALLITRAEDPPTELLRLLDQVVITIALGNADAHAKNYSIVHRGAAVTLSPMYDIAPTIAFLPEQSHAALAIGGKFRIREIARAHVVEEARSWGVPEPEARKGVSSAIERLLTGIEEADDRHPELPSAVREVARRQYERFAASPI